MTNVSSSVLARTVKDRRGTSAIEFALVAPVLALMTVGMSDMALALTKKYKIEQASYRALEMITVGTIQGGYVYVAPEAAAAAGVPESNVTVGSRLECNGTERPFSESCTGTQEEARFITVTIWDDYRPIFPYTPFTRRADGTVRLTAKSTIRVK